MAARLGLNRTSFSQLFVAAISFDLSRIARAHGAHHLLISNTSQAAVRQIRNYWLDAVFIDGDHTFSGVSRDIALMGSKIRPGGYLVFNDYNSPAFPGVTQAVQALAARLAERVHTIGTLGNAALQIHKWAALH
jgi:hypothetical protein